MGTRNRRWVGGVLRPPMRSPGRPPVMRSEHRQRFLASFRWRVVERGRGRGDRCVIYGRIEVVPTGWRDGTIVFCSVVGALSVVCRARRDRDPARLVPWGA